jgi:hypothetical protein
MRLRQAAEYLSGRGYPCSPGTVRALVKEGKIHYRRVGASGRGRYELTEDHLNRFLSESEFRGGAAKPPTERRQREKKPRPAAAVKSPASSPWEAYQEARKA